MRGPFLFSDIGKLHRDVLEKDFVYGKKLTVSNRSGSFMTSILQRNGLSISGIARFKYEKIFNDTSKLASLRNFSLNIKQILEVGTSEDAVSPEVVGEGADDLPYYTRGKMEVQCQHEFWTLAGAVNLNLSPRIDLSATVGVHDAFIGASASFDTSLKTLTNLAGCLSLSSPSKARYSLLLEENGDLLGSFNSYYVVDGEDKVGVVTEAWTRFSTMKETYRIGCLYSRAPLTLKMTYDFGAKAVALLWQRQLKPNVQFTICSEHEMGHLFTTPRLGLALAINL